MGALEFRMRSQTEDLGSGENKMTEGEVVKKF